MGLKKCSISVITILLTVDLLDGQKTGSSGNCSGRMDFSEIQNVSTEKEINCQDRDKPLNRRERAICGPQLTLCNLLGQRCNRPAPRRRHRPYYRSRYRASRPVSYLSNLSNFFTLAPLPDLPALPTLPSLPSLPALPGLPDIPPLPILPNIPIPPLPRLPPFPNIPALPPPPIPGIPG